MTAPKGPTFQPLYKQIKDLLLERIASGEWPPGTFIPSEAALAASYNVSVGTLRKALDELVSDSVVVRRQGKGTAVATHDADRALFRFFNVVRRDGERSLPVSRVLSRQRRRATTVERDALELSDRADVIHIRRVRELAGSPTLLEDIVLDAATFADLASQPEILPNTLYQLYQHQYGATVAHADERLVAVKAGEQDAAHLGVELGEPLIEIRRVARDYQDTPIELRVSRLTTREYCYTSRL
ncbi:MULTISPECIES: GntR family transcriptional regulator [Chromohalobacter]|nr:MULTISPECIES: GntR family transcriptional regulator [Chromohalobacter]MCI0511192.1 GntR family transcriptional regulator [Chromohalobacter sp.]MCI0593572.1 GntR family transcriptional regulator [Chromohalobacter sp.]